MFVLPFTQLKREVLILFQCLCMKKNVTYSSRVKKVKVSGYTEGLFMKNAQKIQSVQQYFLPNQVVQL